MLRKQDQIVKSISDFFRMCKELKNTEEFFKFLNFIKKFPRYAPFNNMLIYLQNPKATYFATARQWEKFGRKIKPESHPMLILMPFRPVELAFDITDTEGKPITDDSFLYWWDCKGELSSEFFENTIRNCALLSIEVNKDTKATFFRMRPFHTFGVAAKDTDGKASVELNPRLKALASAYFTLCHEIAHHLLGHLGKIKEPTPRGRVLMEDRTSLPRNTRELEAEIVAWLVCSRLKIETRAAQYLAMYIKSDDDLRNVGIEEILKVAGKIEQMGKRTIFNRKQEKLWADIVSSRVG